MIARCERLSPSQIDVAGDGTLAASHSTGPSRRSQEVRRMQRVLGARRVANLAAAALAPALLLAPLVVPAPAFAASPAPAATHDHATAPREPASLDTPAAKLRVDLDRLLAEHAFLVIEQMRSGLTAGPDFEAAAKAVEANSTDVANAIGSVYGSAAVQPFGDLWRSHIGYLVDYAISRGKNDAAAAQSALEGLADYRTRVHA